MNLATETALVHVMVPKGSEAAAGSMSPQLVAAAEKLAQVGGVPGQCCRRGIFPGVDAVSRRSECCSLACSACPARRLQIVGITTVSSCHGQSLKHIYG